MKEDAANTGPEGSGDDSWQKIWRLKVPPKVKVFWWRILHEFLSAKHILNRRHIEPTAYCELCGADIDSIMHILINCTFAKVFWREIKLLTGAKLPSLHPISWASDILRDDVCTDKDRNLFIIGMYSLWIQRNKRKHGEQQTPLSSAVKWSVDTTFDLWELSRQKKGAKKASKEEMAATTT